MGDECIYIKIPGSTSNFGSGFDTLGMAVNLYQILKIGRKDSIGFELHHESPRVDKAQAKLKSMVEEASAAFFLRFNLVPFGFKLELLGDLPVGKGLGASGALRAGLIAGLLKLANQPVDLQAVLDLATEIEHHPDNVSPALLGGFTTSSVVNGEARCIQVPVDESLKFVTLIPEFEMDTEKARKLIPSHFAKDDVVHSLNRAAMITAAFSQRRYELLKGLFDDRFHQPHREKLLPQLSEVIKAGENAGAIGGWLSGAGSGIMCMTLKDADKVASAMHGPLPSGRILILSAENKGVQISRVSEGTIA